jgi:hypothetical protein
LTNCKRLVFTNQHHHCHCHKRHHHGHHHHNQKQEIKLKHYFLDLKNNRCNKRFDLQALKARNSCIIINKAKIVNNNTNYTKIKRKSIHQNQHLDLLANFKFYQ